MLPAESRVFKTACADKSCQSVLYTYQNERTVECHQCGQKHSKDSFSDLREVPSDQVKGALKNFLYRIMINKSTPKRGTEMVKVLGLSNYHCKLLSPLLTRYGMDKSTGRAKLLLEMNQGEIFDCSLLSDRAFLIEPEHVSINGFGKDITGSLGYLSETLKLINTHNDEEERLIPIHADGDGHCLVHAISRALVGRELFWHPLRCCLKLHFISNIDKYKELFKDFIDAVEWPSIIDECDPNFQPPDGELHGLRNIHIFGLANVLKRPIILLDSLDCMQKCGDYSALFLPGFVQPEECRGKDNTLNKPLCIAWSSYSHNHYIPLVGIQKMPLPILPATLIPKVWGMPQNQISSYMEFDNNGGCVIGGNRVLSNAYIQRLVHAMEELYYETHGIHPLLVADAKLYLFPDSLLFSAKPAAVLEKAKTAVREGRLFRCLLCRALCEMRVDDFVLKYDSTKSEFVLTVPSDIQACIFCNNPNTLRKVTNDGTVIYKAEDKDTLDRNIMMYDQAKKYINEEGFSQKSHLENNLTRVPLKLFWDGKEVDDEICSAEFNLIKKENLNEYIKELSRKLIEKHFLDSSADVDLQVYISGEIWKLVKKLGFKNLSDLPSNTEFNRQDSAKTMKLESPLSNHSKPSQLQYIKVVTSNGKQANLALTEDGISYGQLQEWIRNEFNISVKNQIIKRGFPPRPIKAFGDTNKQMLPDLKHGDRLLVEIQRRDDTPYSLTGAPPRNILKDSTPPRNLLRDFTLPRNVLKDSNVPKNSIVYPSDISWDIIIKSPANFRSCGFIYKKIAENHILNSSLHTTLDEYPDKVFCYNNMSDTIDLCVKPLGHFLIAHDLEARINEVKGDLHVLGFSKCPLKSKADEGIDSVSYSRTVTSYQDADQSSQPLLRKGPGFSVLRNPDDVDIS